MRQMYSFIDGTSKLNLANKGFATALPFVNTELNHIPDLSLNHSSARYKHFSRSNALRVIVNEPSIMFAIASYTIIRIPEFFEMITINDNNNNNKDS